MTASKNLFIGFIATLLLIRFVPSVMGVVVMQDPQVTPITTQSDVQHENTTSANTHGQTTDSHAPTHPDFTTLLWIAIILLAARMSALLEKIKQPAVLGELLIGVVLGNLTLLGISIFEPIRSDKVLQFFSELGVIILLFQIGLESNITQMSKVGARALLVALVGVVVPFVLGTLVIGPLMLPQLSFNSHLFLGAVLTATSVGITARVFKDFGKLSTPEAQIVLGAAVIDDVLGLIILAVVSAVVQSGSVAASDVFVIVGKAVLFLGGAIVVGQRAAPVVGKYLSYVHRGTGMKFTMAITFGLFLSYFAYLVGLAPIIGAFAAGLVLDPVHFNDYDEQDAVHAIHKLALSSNGAVKHDLMDIVHHHSQRHIEELIAPLSYFFVPLFFVLTGFRVDLSTFMDTSVLVLAAGITFVAFLGKVTSGLVAGSANKLLVGLGMIPRGEVGLIFATAGKALGVVNDQLYAAIVVMIILSTLLTPLALARLLKR